MPGVVGGRGGAAPQILVVDGQAVGPDGNFIGDANSDADVMRLALGDPSRDRFWPKTVISLLVLATVLTLASIQFVSPTRRWHPSPPGLLRRRIRRRSAL
jgi:hypothetical protein